MKKIAFVLSIILCAAIFTGTLGCGNKPVVPPPEANVEYDPEEGIDRDTVIDYLIRADSSAYWIVIAEMANETERYAAEELQSFLAQATGVWLPIRSENLVLYDSDSKVVSIGNTKLLRDRNFDIDYDSLNGDGFVLRTEGKSLFINSDNRRGTLYGVYDFLEKICGVRFFSDDCTFVPELDEIPLYRMDVKEVPVFRYRGLLSDATYHIKDQTFMARCRYVHEFLPLDAKYGGGIEWFDDINTTHNTLTYVKPSEYYATEAQKTQNRHMFYFGDNGDDTPDDICYSDGISENGDIDKTMPLSAAKAALESMKKYILSDPSSKFFIIGQEDIRTCCDCEKCRASSAKYTSCGTVIRFVNAIAKEISKWLETEAPGREVYIVMFAYYFSAEAPVVYDEKTKGYVPVDESVVPAENVYTRLTPITANPLIPLSDPRQISVYDDWLNKWQSITDRFMAWDYYCNYGHYFVYYPTLNRWRETLTDFAEAGVEYMFMQHDSTEYQDWQAIMAAYIGSKMLWNPNRNVEDLRREFISHYFGVAAEEVQTFVDFSDEYYAVNQAQSLKPIDPSSVMSVENQPYEYQKYLYELLENGQKKIDALADAAQRQLLTERLNRVKMTPLYVMVRNSAYYFDRDEEEKGRIVSEFFRICDELGVTYYGERLNISDLRKNYS